MKGWIRRRVLRLAVVTTALLGVAGGIAYATIPDSGKVFHACMLNNLGTIRLIDPTLPSSNLMSKCSPSLETPVSWNQSGQQGIQGIQGLAGPAGADGKNGLDGKDGAPGTPGATGKDGKDGLPGTNGIDGKDGAPGKDGASCLTADGTAALPSCIGPQGPTGPPGPKGDPGKDGKDGSGVPSNLADLNGVPCNYGGYAGITTVVVDATVSMHCTIPRTKTVDLAVTVADGGVVTITNLGPDTATHIVLTAELDVIIPVFDPNHGQFIDLPAGTVGSPDCLPSNPVPSNAGCHLSMTLAAGQSLVLHYKVTRAGTCPASTGYTTSLRAGAFSQALDTSDTSGSNNHATGTVSC